jgi:S-adenosylmethionine synthetase
MGLRTGDDIQLTVAAAMIAPLIPDKDHYMGILQDVRNAVLDQAAKLTSRKVSLAINSADRPEANSFYLTITGCSAEMGDDAGVGRGNRVNGLITPCRPMSLEATAGKNPTSHTGKIYNVLARRIADHVVAEEPRVSEIYVKILSRIGSPLDEPLVASADLIVDHDASWESVKKSVAAIVDAELADVCSVQDTILEGKVRLF